MVLLKDEINSDVVGRLALAFEKAYPDFDVDRFEHTVLADLEARELKDRINLLADTIAEHLPTDYLAALEIVARVADTDPGPWAAWPLCSFVERHGLHQPEASLAAMPALTKRWSCEFAIRPYLRDHLDLTRSYLRRWVHDADEAVRRLPSEGTRPLLPWGPKVAALTDDPDIGIELLRELRHDPSETVRRSVANHLNDVAKSDPERVVEVLADWLSEPEPVDDKMVRHALRTLVKNGHPGALGLLGFTTDPQVTIERFDCEPTEVRLGDHIRLVATIVSTTTSEQHLVVDFVIHHVKASGATSPKVFKWTTQTIGAEATVDLSKRRLIQTASTRRYHAGPHRIDLQIGGVVVATTEFDLVDSS